MKSNNYGQELKPERYRGFLIRIFKTELSGDVVYTTLITKGNLVFGGVYDEVSIGPDRREAILQAKMTISGYLSRLTTAKNLIKGGNISKILENW